MRLPARDFGSAYPSDLSCCLLGFGCPLECPDRIQSDSTHPLILQIETLIGRLEEKHCKELQGVRKEVNSLSSRLTTGESSLATLHQQVTALESLQDAHINTAVALQLHVEEFEDRSKRKHLRLQGLPEATGPKDLAESAAAIFHKISVVLPSLNGWSSTGYIELWAPAPPTLPGCET